VPASETRRALRLGQPIWLGRSRDGTREYPSLSGRLDAEVAIVGGGMTGALVAHTFASAGIATVLIEASSVGRGSTVASSALLLQEPDLELRELTARYGARASRRIWQLGHESVRDLIALLERLHVRCDLQKRDAVYYATDAEGVERLRRELDHRSRSGFDAEWLSVGELRRLTGLPGRGAIRTRGSAQFDPYRACLGVVRAAAAAGAQVFERSGVRRVDVGSIRDSGLRSGTAATA